MPRVISATSNPDKLKEIENIFDSLWGEKVKIISRPKDLPESIESGETFEENALIKAYDVLNGIIGTDLYISKEPIFIMADDTGLSVEALDGAPGIFSARFAGENSTYEENVSKLLKDLKHSENRRAHFTTVIAALFLDGLELVTSGVVIGTILTEPRGDGGFGYDSVFLPDEGEGKTFAEMTQKEKDKLSHRARAIFSLQEILEQLKAR